MASWSVVVTQEIKAAVSDDAGNGVRPYCQYACYGCHRFSSQTGRMEFVGMIGPFLTIEEEFRGFMRVCENFYAFHQFTDMPGYPPNNLDDQIVRDLYAYIRSMKLDAQEITSISAFQSIIDSAQIPYKP